MVLRAMAAPRSPRVLLLMRQTVWAPITCAQTRTVPETPGPCHALRLPGPDPPSVLLPTQTPSQTALQPQGPCDQESLIASCSGTRHRLPSLCRSCCPGNTCSLGSSPHELLTEILHISHCPAVLIPSPYFRLVDTTLQ